MNKRTISSLIKCFVLLILLLPTWLAWDVSPAQAAAILVSRPDDPSPDTCLSGSDCSLREAIILANSSPTTLDEIYLPYNTYIITRAGSDNTASEGDLDITSPIEIMGIRITPSDVVLIEGNQVDRVFEVIGSTGSLTLGMVTVSGGKHTTMSGGGILCTNASVTLEDVILLENNATTHDGGGLAADQCTVSINGSSITSNSAARGGGISLSNSTLIMTSSGVYDNHSTLAGGGIYSENSDLTLLAVTLAYNIAATSGGGLFQLGSTASLLFDHSLAYDNQATSYEGGGICAKTGSSLDIINSTISNNIAYTYGGGVSTSIPTTINHSTIVYNHADMNVNNDGNGGGLFAYTGSTVTISNTILARNTDHSIDAYHDCGEYAGGDVVSNGYNLVESDGNCTIDTPGDIVGVEPLIGPLQDNGGWSLTHALLVGSPAIDAGDPSVTRVNLANYDQRGPSTYRRVINGQVDIGAFEAWLDTFLPVIFR